MGKRTSKRTRYPGIYEVVGGRSTRYMVSYRIRGLGQRTRTFSTLAEAKQFQGSVRDPLRQRQLRDLEQGRVTLASYFPQWLERKRNLTPATRLRYEGIGRNYISTSRLARLPVSGITRDDVEDWLTELIDNGVPLPTVDKTYRTLRPKPNDPSDTGRRSYWRRISEFRAERGEADCTITIWPACPRASCRPFG